MTLNRLARRPRILPRFLFSVGASEALLEAMEEHRVSVDGTTHRLPDPFMVVATQNPSDSQGTYPLPEAQRDRFMARISMGYPDTDAEVLMLGHHTHDPERTTPLLQDEVEPVMDVDTARELIAATAMVAVGEPVRRYLVELGQATRAHADVRVGASPRALVQWMSAARAEAALSGRDYVVPDDVRAVARGAPVRARPTGVRRGSARGRALEPRDDRAQQRTRPAPGAELEQRVLRVPVQEPHEPARRALRRGRLGRARGRRPALLHTARASA